MFQHFSYLVVFRKAGTVFESLASQAPSILQVIRQGNGRLVAHSRTFLESR